MKVNDYQTLLSNGWALIGHKNFLWFIWDERWYWTKIKPHYGPCSTNEALAIQKFIEDKKVQEALIVGQEEKIFGGRDDC